MWFGDFRFLALLGMTLADSKTKQPTESPSPLMGEESKVRVNKTTSTTPTRHTGFKAVSTGWGMMWVGDFRFLALLGMTRGGHSMGLRRHHSPSGSRIKFGMTYCLACVYNENLIGHIYIQ